MLSLIYEFVKAIGIYNNKSLPDKMAACDNEIYNMVQIIPNQKIPEMNGCNLNNMVGCFFDVFSDNNRNLK